MRYKINNDVFEFVQNEIAAYLNAHPPDVEIDVYAYNDSSPDVLHATLEIDACDESLLAFITYDRNARVTSLVLIEQLRPIVLIANASRSTPARYA